jgi:hypothetical protein
LILPRAVAVGALALLTFESVRVATATATPIEQPQVEDSNPALHPASFENLKPGTFLRLQLADTRILEGPVGGVSGGTCRFDDVKGITVEFTQVHAAWRRTSAAPKGGFWGALLCATAVSLYLADQGASPPQYLIGFAIGSIGGGLLGGAVGAAFHDWEPLELR